MKALSTMIVEQQDVLKTAGIDFAEAVKDAISEEHRLSILKSLAKKNGIKESVEIRESRIERKNGTGGPASGVATEQERIAAYMRKGSCSFREASILCGLPDPGPKATASKEMVEARAARWKKHCGGTITEADAMTLAEKGIEP